jgi:hypothetical protein
MSKIRKAVLAGVGSAVTAIVTPLVNGTALSWPIVASAVVAGIVFGYGVWRTPNAPAK